MTPRFRLWVLLCPCLLLAALPAFAVQQRARAVVTIFLVVSSDGSGIRIWPGQNLTPPRNVVDALHTAARTAHLDVRRVIYPEQADCILNLQLNEVHSGALQFWTVLDAASGTEVQNGRSRSVSLAVHDAVKVLGRHCVRTPGPVPPND